MSERHRSVLFRHEEGHTGRHNNVATPHRRRNAAAPPPPPPQRIVCSFSNTTL
ncbi:hypothetical protein JYU34_019938 [Plutella xylostella]|uniref:Uncharacterized protein n=1 Tax=Plutella xylostella TaxID=51655 RepID=A0ABQ7PVL0_PLUXY|nr:hypothetical protein JYU34_019938 [Plutella xylostella]